MHEGPQVPHEVRENVANLEDHGREPRYRCGCGRSFLKEDSSYWKHTVNCADSTLQENVDYLVCRICGYKARALTKHVVAVHNLSKADYGAETLAPAARLKYSIVGKVNGVGHGEAKSKGILVSPSARNARSQNLSSINRRPERRKRSSEVAKETSARLEIIESRSKNLQRWRENHPDDFYSKCTRVMIDTKQSLPEKKLFDQLKSLLPNIKRNQRIYNVEFSTSSRRRQIDILDVAAKIIIEYDGPVHFKPFFGVEKLAKVRKSDLELNEVLVKNGFKVIRVACDQYVKGAFSESCLKKIVDAALSLDVKLHLIGESYGESYLSEKDW